MFDSAAQTSEPTPPAVSSARERMGILRRMSEIGLRMAERLDRQSEIAALHAECSAVSEAERPECARRLQEMTRAFAHVTRAVSVCVALEDRIERGPPLPQSQPFGPELVCPIPRESRLRTRRDEVQWAVRAEIDAHADIAPARVEDFCRRLDDLLDREVAAVDAFLTRPLDETIARLCGRLGLDPELAASSSERGHLARDAGGTPALRERSGEGASLAPSASPDAEDPSIPCRERSLAAQAGQGRAQRARRGAAGLRPDLEQPGPASKIACMDQRTVRAQGP